MPNNDERDPTRDFLNSLPEIAPGDSFSFACHPGVPCFNACCRDLNLLLTPYDVLRLRKGLGLDSASFLQRHAAVSTYPDTGFPMLHLRMSQDEGNPCPFVSPAGCTVYQDRPSACRTYPIGCARRYSPERRTITEHFFLVREDHCRGFAEQQSWCIATWTQDQGLEPYTASNNRFSLLMAAIKATGRTLHPRHATMCLLALYQVERFQTFLREMKVLEKVRLSQEERETVLTDAAYCLDFAMDWLELTLFGKNARLAPAGE